MAMADNGLPGSPRPDRAWEHAALAWQLLDVFQHIQRAMRGGRAGASGPSSSGTAGVGISGAAVRQALYRMGGNNLRPELNSEPKPNTKLKLELASAAFPAVAFLPRSRVAGSGAASLRGLAHKGGPERRMRRGGRRGVAPGLRGDRPTERPGGLSGLSGRVFEGAAGGAGGVSARRGRTRSDGGPVARWGGASGRRQVSWGGGLLRPGLPAPQRAAGQTGSSGAAAGRITQEQLAEPEAGQAKGAETFARAMLRAILPGEALSRMRTARVGAAGGRAGGHGVSLAQPAPFPARTAHWLQAGTSEPSGVLPSAPHAAGAYARGMHAAVQAAMARTVPGPTATDTARASTANREVLAKTQMENDAFSIRTGAEARGVSGLKAQARHANMGMR